MIMVAKTATIMMRKNRKHNNNIHSKTMTIMNKKTKTKMFMMIMKKQ